MERPCYLLLVQVWVFATDLNPSLSAACQLADQSFGICSCTEPDYPSHVLELCLAHGIKLVIPTIDTELQALSESRDAFAAAGVQLVVSDSALIRQCSDKRLTAGLFTSLALLTPMILDPSSLTFPCFMKPVRGSSSHGIKSIPSADHLSLEDTRNPNNLFRSLFPVPGLNTPLIFIILNQVTC